ncbi:hydrophobe/amphiphile efflux-3 (HAE3) family transporter [Methanocella arvoryzae]|uniref:Transporter (RND superfamily) n=1 Tax=Methanocella arvoryzae (strain DSM 22066 / NBRC 105507 / MRE50) TaxID=351160 RepID=Q0W6W9_METAR|nr:hydrophobe/amphiphile efflux-3 (HAE3) family transporter [Methanocella arvoryzae]CAJ35874.1 putative transporter (RND superfamily) [Methanocella arvoryzae MRE50]
MVVRTVDPGETIGRFIKNHYVFIIVMAVLLLILAMVSAQKIYMATGIETFVFKDSQIYKDIEYYTENFQATNFLILITTDDVFSPDVLEAMRLLDSQIRVNPKVQNVTGLYTILDRYSSGGIVNSAQAERIISLLPGEATRFLVPGKHHTIMSVLLRGDLEEAEKPAILEDVKSAIRWVPMPAGSSARVTGETAMMLEIQDEMMRSMSIMLASAVIMMIIALWFTFSHSKWRLLPLPIVLVGVIFTGGIMGITGVPLTMVSMAVFPILIGLGVEYAIQFQNRMMEELADGKAPGDAVVATVKNIGPPVAYSVMTCLLGFLSILASPVPMIYDFGLMCMIGVAVCFLSALFLLLSVLVLLSSKAGRIQHKVEQRGVIEKVIERVAETTTRHPVIVIFALVAMIAGYALDPTIGVEIDQSSFAPQDLPSVVLFRSLTNIMDVKTTDMIVQVKAHDVTAPDTVRWMQNFSLYEKSNNPDVLAVSSLNTLMASYNDGVVPDTGPEIQAVLDRIPWEEQRRYIDDYRTTSIITMTINDLPTDQQMSMLRRVERDLSFLSPPAGISATLSGQSRVMLTTLGSLTSDRLQMTLASGLLVLIGLLIVYRGDWVRSVVPVIAVVIVTGLSCIVMIILHMKYTPLSVTLGALTIGIGIDFSILHMERYYEEKAKGFPPLEAMRIATAKIGNAIFSSASTVIAGFGALVMSNFSILSNFGLVTIIDFILALCSAFVIMPPLLVTLDTWWSKVRGVKV